MSKIKESPKFKKVYVPIELHREIRILAARRNASIQTIATMAVVDLLAKINQEQARKSETSSN